MKKYPTLDGFQTTLKLLRELDVEIDYLHQEIIRSELMNYRKKVLEETFNIHKDPVPLSAIEVSEKSIGKGVFILFINPLDYVEIVEEDGKPVSKEELATSFGILSLIGLFVSKEDPNKTQLSIAPPQILNALKDIREEEFTTPVEKLNKDNTKIIEN